MSNTATIFAPATAAGPAAIAVVRVSGPKARNALRTLTRRRVLPRARVATLRRLYAAEDDIIDDALILWFPGTQSFTGEDTVEFHIHGGADVQASLLAALSACDGLEPAAPGGFTRQAVVNGRLDLTQAEAIADLVNADSPAQRWQALQQKQGALARLYDSWRKRLLDALAYMEAELEFVDDGLPGGLSADSIQDVNTLLAMMTTHLGQKHSERVHNGFEIALIGAPNVGKSSLINHLAGRDAAIVSKQAGTTRDIIEVRLALAGFPVVMLDMAGLRTARGAVEQAGVRRAIARARDADIRLFLRAPRCALPGKAEQALFQEGDMLLFNKADLKVKPPADYMPVSAKTGAGISRFLRALGERLEARHASGDQIGFTRTRHRQALEQACTCLRRAVKAHSQGRLELAAEDVRLATRALGSITGQVDIERMLDIVFADFCIGK